MDAEGRRESEFALKGLGRVLEAVPEVVKPDMCS
jgi:hypothetical protein